MSAFIEWLRGRLQHDPNGEVKWQQVSAWMHQPPLAVRRGLTAAADTMEADAFTAYETAVRSRE